MTKIITKAISLLSVIAIICTMLPTTLVASAADKTKVQIENASGLATKHDMTIGDGYTVHATDYWCMIHTVGSQRAVYCLEPGKSVSSGDEYNESLATDYLKKVKNNILTTEEIHTAIGRVFLYAYTGTLDSVEAYNRYAATQLLVWEVIVGQRDVNFNRVNNGYTPVENMLSNFQSEYAGQIVSGYYYEYEALIKAHSKAISFANRSETIAKATAVQAGTDGTYTFTDSNNMLGSFDATVSNGSVVSKSGNSLKIKADDGKTAVVTLTQNNVNESGELTGFLTLTNNSTQTLAELKADPRKYYVAVKGLENGNLEIVKTSEDGIIANIEFTVSGNGKTYNVKTDSKGKISIADLTAGEYTVTEVVPVRYETQQTKKVTVQAGKTATVSFANTLKTGAIKINKQSDDGDNGGRTFTISGNGKTYTINTNSYGIAILSDIPVYDSNNNKIEYTISEKNVPIKYVVPANQTATLTADATTTKAFKNVLKKFTVTVEKLDAEKKIAQGDATLAGAVYGIYNNGSLVDTYTTNANGSFTTKEYICGDSWTIQEISASKGYLIDTTVHKVGAESKNYSIEKNPISMTVYEDVIKGDVAIIKHSDDGRTQIETPEKGAEFQIYLKSAGSYSNAKASEKDVLICDENGYAKSKQMPYGTYVVHQTKGWENTEWMQDFDVTISKNGKTYQYIINDAVLKSLVKIVKKDIETGKIIPVSGIGFKVWDCKNNCFVSQSFNYPTPTTIDTFYTDESGSLMMPEELIYGDYELHEVQTADGYYLGTEVIPFSIDGQETVITVEKFNVAQKGKISVQKTGDSFVSVAIASSAYIDENGEMVVNPTTYTPVFAETGLANAVYQVIASEDIITADGTVHAYAGEVVAELTTDENGFAQTSLLYLGKYEIKEITAPYGYVLNSESQIVELTYAGQEIEVRDTVETSFVNDYQGVEISLEKLMENDTLFGIFGEDCYSNVRFELFADEEIIAVDGSAIPQEGLITEVTLDESMKAIISEKIPFGRYYVQEISTDKHYMLNGEKYLVTFEYMGQECTTVYLNANDGNAIENFIIRGSVEGKKVSETGEPLANAVFGLFPVSTVDFTTQNAYMTAVSDENGCFSFDEIPYGEYVIREIEAPDGYILSDESYPVVVSENAQVVEITAENKPITVEISKRDVYGNELKGATMLLIDENGNVVDEWVSDGTNHVVSKLLAGKYTLKEVASPDGYVIATDSEFEVDIYGVVTVNGVVATANDESGNPLIIMIDDTTKVQISKRDMTTGEELEGAKLQIIDKDGNVIEEWISGKEPHFIEAKLIAGETYTLHEVIAPDGYEIANDIEFTVSEDGSVDEVVMYDELIPVPQETPKTGDAHSNLLAWLMIVGGLAMVTIVAFRKRKELSNAEKVELENASRCPDFIEVNDEN